MDFLLLALATWRITSLLVNEAGPYQMFHRFRYLVGIRYDTQSQPVSTNEIAAMLLCSWCTSFWVALILSILWLLLPDITRFLCLFLAASTVSIVVGEWLEKRG